MAVREPRRRFGMAPYPRVVEELPAGFVVTVDPGDRIHFLDWGGPAYPGHVEGPEGSGGLVGPGGPGRSIDRRGLPADPGILLIHGLSGTAWNWTPVARQLAAHIHVAAMDLRGHGLSDAPTDDGAYDLDVQAEDAIAAAEGSRVLDDPGGRVVLAGHGFGGIVAAWAAARLGARCAGLVLVDGGWERVGDALGMDADEFLRGIDEPPEVMRSMRAFLADRRAFDPASWDADQETAARATVVETHAGRVVPATRPHAMEATVRAMFEHDPLAVLPSVEAPITAIVAADPSGDRRAELERVSESMVSAGRAAIVVLDFAALGHNLMRYRPREVTDAILRAVESSVGGSMGVSSDQSTRPIS